MGGGGVITENETGLIKSYIRRFAGEDFKWSYVVLQKGNSPPHINDDDHLIHVGKNWIEEHYEDLFDNAMIEELARIIELKESGLKNRHICFMIDEAEIPF